MNNLNNKTKQKIIESWGGHETQSHPTFAPLPNTLMIEVTNACNLKCTMCKNPEMQRKKGRISLDLLDDLLRQAKDIGIDKVALYTTGEPFMHPEIFEIIKRVAELGFYTYITTNALLLDEERINRLLNSGVASVKYSLDGLDKKEYESIRIKGDYDKVINNIKIMKRERDGQGLKVKLIMGIILAKYNYMDKQKYIDRYAELVDEIIFSMISNQAGFIGSKDYVELAPDDLKVNTNWRPCRQLWDRMVVAYDGSLVGCCIDFEADLVYGDVKSQPLMEAWNSPSMQSLRAAHKLNDLSDYPLCQGCDSPYLQQIEVFKKINE